MPPERFGSKELVLTCADAITPLALTAIHTHASARTAAVVARPCSMTPFTAGAAVLE